MPNSILFWQFENNYVLNNIESIWIISLTWGAAKTQHWGIYGRIISWPSNGSCSCSISKEILAHPTHCSATYWTISTIIPPNPSGTTLFQCGLWHSSRLTGLTTSIRLLLTQYLCAQCEWHMQMWPALQLSVSFRLESLRRRIDSTTHLNNR